MFITSIEICKSSDMKAIPESDAALASFFQEEKQRLCGHTGLTGHTRPEEG